MSVIAIIVLTVVVLAVVIGLGVLIFKLQRRAQTVVPRVADGDREGGDRVVAVDADGRAVTAAEDTPEKPRPGPAAFEQVLSEELDTLHRPGQGDAAEGASPER